MNDKLIYRSEEGETLADIAYKFYGKTFGAIEIIMQANERLSYLPTVLPLGTLIEIDIERKIDSVVSEALDLWE